MGIRSFYDISAVARWVRNTSLQAREAIFYETVAWVVYKPSTKVAKSRYSGVKKKRDNRPKDNILPGSMILPIAFTGKLYDRISIPRFHPAEVGRSWNVRAGTY